MEIMDENGKKFVSFFENLFQIEAFLVSQEIKTNILETSFRTIKPLLNSSVYYCRLLTKVLTKPINFDTRPLCLLEMLQSNDSPSWYGVLWSLFQDIASMTQLAKVYIPIKNSRNDKIEG